jgi:hypothetical protein
MEVGESIGGHLILKGGLLMKRILIAYFSASGTTEKMAEYIAEGVRFSGQEAVTKRVEDIKVATELAGYDGYILGSPTYALDVPEPMKRFLLIAKKQFLGERWVEPSVPTRTTLATNTIPMCPPSSLRRCKVLVR